MMHYIHNMCDRDEQGTVFVSALKFPHQSFYRELVQTCHTTCYVPGYVLGNDNIRRIKAIEIWCLLKRKMQKEIHSLLLKQ